MPSPAFPRRGHIQGAMITDKGCKTAAMQPRVISRRSHVKARTRFLKSVISTAKSDSTELPWTRGTTRQARLATRRSGLSPAARSPRLKSA